MPPVDQMKLSRRERQIMDILFEQGECSAQDVLERIPDPPSYSSIRALIARLVEKAYVEYRTEGTKHIYRPKIEEQKAQSSAIQRLLKTFFKGSKFSAVNALLDEEGNEMSERELANLERTIARLRKNRESE